MMFASLSLWDFIGAMVATPIAVHAAWDMTRHRIPDAVIPFLVCGAWGAYCIGRLLGMGGL